MAAASLFMSRHDIDAHIRSMIPLYRGKRDLTLETARAAFPAEVRFTHPRGGLFTWLTFPEDFDAAIFMRDGDSRGAETAMRSHLKSAENDLKAVMRGGR